MTAITTATTAKMEAIIDRGRIKDAKELLQCAINLDSHNIMQTVFISMEALPHRTRIEAAKAIVKMLENS